jgi:hypothetical protein
MLPQGAVVVQLVAVVSVGVFLLDEDVVVEGTSMLEMENDLSANWVAEKDTQSSNVTRVLIRTLPKRIKVHQLLCRHLMTLIQLGMRI